LAQPHLHTPAAVKDKKRQVGMNLPLFSLQTYGEKGSRLVITKLLREMGALIVATRRRKNAFRAKIWLMITRDASDFIHCVTVDLDLSQ
jgi:hypothetical protein